MSRPYSWINAGQRRSSSRGNRALLPALLACMAAAFPGGAASEQASEPASTLAGQLDAGRDHACAVVGGSARCWGFGGAGQLGYASTNTIGDDEAPGSAGPLNLGPRRSATAISAGLAHSCALVDDSSVRCWGFGRDGRLGYANTETIGDDETPGSAGPVDLGPGRSGSAISAGGNHSCAVLDDGNVRCWGFGFYGQLGYANTNAVGDDEAPGSIGPVNLGPGAHARAISAGARHSCALLEDGSVRCWGSSGNGQLGYGSTAAIGDDEAPGSVGPVDLGAGRSARAISAGDFHSCAVLDDGSVRCWGLNESGQLGYGNTRTIGDNESPSSVAPVDLGPGRRAVAIGAGSAHTCALLDDDSVRCWGLGAAGRLGYANTNTIGDDEVPAAVGPVNLGFGESATALSAGGAHTCARLDDAGVSCWGYGANGRLGLCSTRNIGDDEPPGTAGPVRLAAPAAGGSGCAAAATPPARRVGAAAADPETAALRAQAARLRGLRSCLASVRRHGRRELGRARRLSRLEGERARRHIRRHRSQLRRRCLKRWARTPGAVTGLTARAVSPTRVLLRFKAAGTHGSHPPAARAYLVKQSRRPIRGARAFRRAQSLCAGSCRFPPVRVGASLTLTVSDLRPRTTYYYAVAVRDNVSRQLGPRSRPVKVRTR